MTRFRLTAREAQVALLMARGDRNRVIASALGTSVHTVRRQAERVLSKLGVSTRAAIAGRIT
jgi:DNA-binding NarL/FixJ family response regulator